MIDGQQQDTGLQPLDEQTKTGTVREYQLDLVGALRPERLDRSEKGSHRPAYQCRRSLGTRAEVDGFGRDRHADRAGRADHGHLSVPQHRCHALYVHTAAHPNCHRGVLLLTTDGGDSQMMESRTSKT